jgi:hypothetical protein
MENVEFTYLYRDGGNYKKWGRVVFSDPDGLNCETIETQLQQAFMEDGLFIATQIRVPDVFLHIGGAFSSDDHCYHEFDALRSTVSAVNDPHGRSISDFLAEANRESEIGWQAFDPYDSKGSLGSYLTSRARRA